MKNVLLTAALIAAAVASGDLLAKATVTKTPPSRAAAAAEYKTSPTVSDGRLRASFGWLASGKPTAQ